MHAATVLASTTDTDNDAVMKGIDLNAVRCASCTRPHARELHFADRRPNIIIIT